MTSGASAAPKMPPAGTTLQGEPFYAAGVAPCDQAWPEQVNNSQLKPVSRLLWRVLVDHLNRGKKNKPYDGIVYRTDEQLMQELGGISKKVVQRARAELFTSGWICFPAGDAGGRGNKIIYYHLHPHGGECDRPKQRLKQRNTQANENRARANRERHQKVDTNVHLYESRKVDKITVKVDRKHQKVDKSDDAYKEEPLHKPLQQTSSTTTPPTNDGGETAEPEVVDDLLANAPDFLRLEHVCGETIAGSGRARILRASMKYGFRLQQLEWFFAREYGLNRAGGLIRLAENWMEETSYVVEWPSCYVCLGTGVELPPKIKTESRTGRRDARVSTVRRDPTESEIAEARTCGAMFCGCSAGRIAEEREVRERERVAATTANRDTPKPQRAELQTQPKVSPADADIRHRLLLQARNICADCEGSGCVPGTEHKCWHCSGTGQHYLPQEWIDQGKCGNCCGSGESVDFASLRDNPPKLARCETCGGSGKAPPRRSTTARKL